MKARFPRAGAAVALAAAATLAVSGCTGANPAAAATVNGSTISESSLKEIVTDLNAERQGTGATSHNVLQYMILNEIVATSGTQLPPVSADEARSMIRQDPMTSGGTGFGIADPSSALVEFMQGQLTIERAAEARTLDQQKLAQLVRDARIEVNPKYGTGFDPQQGLISTTPNWFEATTPAPRGGAPGQPMPEQPVPTGPPETLPGPAPTSQ